MVKSLGARRPGSCDKRLASFSARISRSRSKLNPFISLIRSSENALRGSRWTLVAYALPWAWLLRELPPQLMTLSQKRPGCRWYGLLRLLALKQVAGLRSSNRPVPARERLAFPFATARTNQNSPVILGSCERSL